MNTARIRQIALVHTQVCKWYQERGDISGAEASLVTARLLCSFADTMDAAEAEGIHHTWKLDSLTTAEPIRVCGCRYCAELQKLKDMPDT